MRKILACFVQGIESDPRFQGFIQSLEAQGYEPAVFFDTLANGIRPEDTLHLLEYALADSLGDASLVFVSNIPRFYWLTYRLYHQTYDGFVYYSDEESAQRHWETDDPVYSALTASPPQVTEALDKPSYYVPIDGSETLPFDHIHTWVRFDPQHAPSEWKHTPSAFRKIYHVHREFHVFEPADGPAAIIDLMSGVHPATPFYDSIVYRYPDKMPEQVTKALQEINGFPQNFANRYANYSELFELYAKMLAEASFYAKKFARAAMEDMLEFSRPSTARYFLLSFLLNVFPDVRYHQKLLESALEDGAISRSAKFFLLWQSSRISFLNGNVTSRDTDYLQRKLYRQIYRDFRQELLPGENFIPREDRNPDVVFVMTGQFLSLNHAPTKTALDRCYHLIASLHKKVVLINTKELLSLREIVPFYNITVGNVIKEYEQKSSVSFKNIEVPYYQPSTVMPDPAEMVGLLESVRKAKPYFILSIGGANLTADLCSNLVPVINLSVPYNSLSITESPFHVLGRRATDSDIRLLKDFGFKPENLIESVFTFDFKKQENTYTREQFGLPADKKLLLIVGYRLDQEASEDFLKALLETTDRGTHLVFLGGFDLAAWNSRVPGLAEHSANLGFQEDVLAILDLCDIYCNPKRGGGGTSVVEAMFKGLPAVTLPVGDVSTSVPDEFRVDSFDQMRDRIIQYVTDSQHYDQMSSLARETAEALMNTREELRRIIEKAEQSPDF
ncbi:glycosyltransferase [Cohnella caldifontis]|uniref:glycosyltransferase n=1 Tax=Cohnella caldifontis TaxID=3027471 RepID=UPI0023EBD7A2|nr:glycosyltransferase [Cohnella sp. YIM B05605]